MKKIIIRHDYELSGFLLENLDDMDVYPISAFSDFSFFIKRKRNVFYYLLLGLILFLTLFKKKSKTDVLIFFDVEDLLSIAIMTLYFNPKKRSIWVWNPLSRMRRGYRNKYLKFAKFLGYELWSFDPEDARQYSINYHPQVYRDDIISHCFDSKKIDVLFIGQDKQRIKKLVEIKDKLNAFGISNHFHVMAKPGKIYSVDELNIVRNDGVKYEDYLELCFQSKCLLDIIQENQQGLTLRCMEAVFLDKKLITNNEKVKDYDFYHPENIFILNDDNMESIRDFMSSDYVKIDDAIKEKYNIKKLIEAMIG